MIDTHCHLTDSRIAEQLPGVLERATAAGVHRLVTIGTHRDDWGPTLAICHGRPNIRCALGIHPNHCNESDLADVAALEPRVMLPEVAAVGEMGLDYHYGRVPKAKQADFF